MVLQPLVGLGPVSYTHLDVYKRQEYIVVDDDKHLPVGRVNVLVVAEYCNSIS